jgi:hypothetical protein
MSPPLSASKADQHNYIASHAQNQRRINSELSKAYKLRHAKCPKPTTRPSGGRGNRSLFVKVFMMQNDKNGDGVVDKSEFRGSDDRFDQMDKNSNGKLEAEELTDLHKRRMQDPKSMHQRRKSCDRPGPPPDFRR